MRAKKPRKTIRDLLAAQHKAARAFARDDDDATRLALERANRAYDRVEPGLNARVRVSKWIRNMAIAEAKHLSHNCDEHVTAAMRLYAAHRMHEISRMIYRTVYEE